ncbi:centromere protein W [Ambystoma mexicanum]|uniref:centromere protein W n=1 Tax=Ambystoma mexicanum TaxID=8296 RepID=UPI0037E8B834
MNLRASRGAIRASIKKHRKELRLTSKAELLVHLSILLYIRRLAEESRIEAYGQKCNIIKPEHVASVVAMVLKKSKG